MRACMYAFAALRSESERIAAKVFVRSGWSTKRYHLKPIHCSVLVRVQYILSSAGPGASKQSPSLSCGSKKLPVLGRCGGKRLADRASSTLCDRSFSSCSSTLPSAPCLRMLCTMQKPGLLSQSSLEGSNLNADGQPASRRWASSNVMGWTPSTGIWSSAPSSSGPKRSAASSGGALQFGVPATAKAAAAISAGDLPAGSVMMASNTDSIGRPR